MPAFISWAPDGTVWKLFDLFIGLIQAFIFALLSDLYFSMAMEPEGRALTTQLTSAPTGLARWIPTQG